jgi:hypothetical protein
MVEHWNRAPVNWASSVVSFTGSKLIVINSLDGRPGDRRWQPVAPQEIRDPSLTTPAICVYA